MKVVISQILAGIALALFMVSYFIKVKYKFLFIQLLATVLNASSYLVLGAFIGGAVSFVSAFRTATFFILEKRNFSLPSLFLPCFIALYSAPSLIFYSSWPDLFAWISPILTTIALLFKNLKTVKTITIFALLTFSVYSFVVQNWVGFAELVIEAVIIVIALIIDESKARKERLKTKEQL